MDLIQENPVKENKTKKLKTSLIIIFVLIAILIIVAIVIYVFSRKVAEDQFKVFLDGTRSYDMAKENIFLIEDGKVYTSIKAIAPHIGYTIYNGEYKQYSEDTTNCYATNQKEIVTFSTGKDSIRKYPQLGQSESQSFDLSEEITTRGNTMYICEDGLERAFNLSLSYDINENSVTIYTLPYLTSVYEKQITNASLTKSELSDSIIFNNEKALLYNYVVIKDKSNGLFGVALYKDGTTSTVITERYKSVEFIEGINDFIVVSTDNKYGIIGSDGITKVKPAYDMIQEIDKDIGLYLVSSNGKQGVINQNGKIIVYQDYDKVGLDGEIQDINVTNRYLLYNNCIPVQLNKKWGLIDKNGEVILPLEYDGIGCQLDSNQTNTTGIVLIPELKGIVIERDFINESDTIRKYGVIDSTGTGIVNIVADSAYATTISNKTTYYLNIQNQIIDIVSYYYEHKDEAEKDYVNKQQQALNEITNEIQAVDQTQNNQQIQQEQNNQQAQQVQQDQNNQQVQQDQNNQQTQRQ